MWSLVAAAFVFGMLRPGKAAPGVLTQDVTIQHGGITRYFDYYVPANLPSEAVPLVIVLHGGTGDNKYTEGLDSPGAAWMDLDTGDNSTVTRELYSNGVQGTEVSFHKVIGGGHELPSVDYRIGLIFQLIVGKQNHDLEFVVEAWNFFERHELNGTLNGPTMAVYYGVAADDGWTLESSETSGVGGSRNNSDIGTTALRVGDNGSDRQYRTIVSFDTSPIPDAATILSTTLRLRRGTVSGTNPFTTHGACYLDVKTGGFNANAALENADFQSLADVVQAGALCDATANGEVSDGALDSAGRAAVNKTGKTQMRVYFSLDDNDDSGVDYVGFYSANNSTWRNRPRIYVQYQ